MKAFIFAIGGTGARVLRSLSFLLAADPECIPDDTTIVPLILDYDQTNGDKERTKRNLEKYMELRAGAYAGVTTEKDEHNFFMPDLKYLSDVDVLDNGQNQQKVALAKSFDFTFGLNRNSSSGTFADYVDLPNMMGDTYLTRDLLESLYNNQDETDSFTELNLDLEKGFKGNPNIGSVLFENLKDTQEFKKFFNAFDPNRDRIFIISSIFGGTGSSGFPQIVNAIRNCGIQGYNQALMGAAVVMPYFKVDTPAGGTINSNIFASKQKAALSQYNDLDENGMSLYNKLTTTYFIADDNPTTLAYSEGQNTQINNAHLVELLTAAGILDFITTDSNRLRANPYREFGLQNDVDAGKEINMTHFSKADQDKWLLPLLRMALAFRFHKEYVETEEISSKVSFYSNKGLDIASELNETWFEALSDYINDFRQWLDEMYQQKTKFRPVLHTPLKNQENEDIAEDLYDYINGYEASSGSLFKNGASFKDFASSCDKFFKENKHISNDDYLLLAIYYEAAKDCIKHYKKIV